MTSDSRRAGWGLFGDPRGTTLGFSLSGEGPSAGSNARSQLPMIRCPVARPWYRHRGPGVGVGAHLPPVFLWG